MARKTSLKNAKQVDQKAGEYFERCDENKKPYAISGLAMALGLSRKELLCRQHEGAIGKAIKKALAQCELSAEERLLNGKNVSGVIFSLKSNWGWTDKPESEGKEKDSTPLKIELSLKPSSVDYSEVEGGHEG
jgi:hypothetical protein